jgi:hypothetical protein
MSAGWGENQRQTAGTRKQISSQPKTVVPGMACGDDRSRSNSVCPGFLNNHCGPRFSVRPAGIRHYGTACHVVGGGTPGKDGWMKWGDLTWIWWLGQESEPAYDCVGTLAGRERGGGDAFDRAGASALLTARLGYSRKQVSLTRPEEWE